MVTRRTKRTTTQSPEKIVGGPTYITAGDARELIDTMLRQALSEQSRNLESHLNDIHKRLINLEK